MFRILYKLLPSLIVGTTLLAFTATASAEDSVDRESRLLIIEGNKLYNQKRYNEAEELYKKALDLSPANDLARYNLAATYVRQGNGTNEQVNLLQEGAKIFDDIARNSDDARLQELAAYNAGNLQFNDDQYSKSIEYYKMALRKNPDNDKARENLRIAQLKLQQQQNQDQNQQQNQDQNQQDQNQNQQDQNQNQQDQNQDQQQQPQQSQQQEQQIDEKNAAAILKTMQNEENRTRERIERRKQKDAPRRPVTNPW